jgi:hypothetical protein
VKSLSHDTVELFEGLLYFEVYSSSAHDVMSNAAIALKVIDNIFFIVENLS